MSWCPKCLSEYRDGYVTCFDCGEKLVDTITETDHPGGLRKASLSSAKNASQPESFLSNISDAVELSYVTSLLNEAKIPYRIISEDVGQYLQILHGKSFFGKSLYVDKNKLAEAMEILNSYKSEILKEDALVVEDTANKNGLPMGIAPFTALLILYIIIALTLGIV